MATRRIGKQKNILKRDEIPERPADNYISTYAHAVEVGTTPWDLRIHFLEISEDENGDPIREKKATITMPLPVAQILTRFLNQSLQDRANTQDDIEDE